jgi:hypothetical protein
VQTAREQVLNIRILVLEDAIRLHRRMVRDGWTSKWRDRDPDEYLWRLIDDE